MSLEEKLGNPQFKSCTRAECDELIDAIDNWVSKKIQYKGAPVWNKDTQNWDFPRSYSDGRWQEAEKRLVRIYLGTPVYQ